MRLAHSRKRVPAESKLPEPFFKNYSLLYTHPRVHKTTLLLYRYPSGASAIFEMRSRNTLVCSVWLACSFSARDARKFSLLEVSAPENVLSSFILFILMLLIRRLIGDHQIIIPLAQPVRKKAGSIQAGFLFIFRKCLGIVLFHRKQVLICRIFKDSVISIQHAYLFHTVLHLTCTDPLSGGADPGGRADGLHEGCLCPHPG